MPALPLYDFSGGIDRRTDRTLLSPDSQWIARNVWSDSGKRLRRRFGSFSPANGTWSAVAGLWWNSNTLYTFAIKGTVFSAPGVSVIQLDQSNTGNTVIKRVLSVDLYGQYPYIVVQYGDDSIRHHYVDGSLDTRVTDASCPHTASVTVVNNRVWAITEVGTVRFTTATSARDWSTGGGTATGSGFLPVSQNMAGIGNPTAVGQFQNDLAVFFESGVQVWFPDTDATKIFIRQRIYGVGTTHPRAVVPFQNDLAFFGPAGIRSVTVSSQTTNREDSDLGAPIMEAPLGCTDVDAGGGFFTEYLVYPRWATQQLGMSQILPFARYIAQLGQVWFVFPKIYPADTLSDGTTNYSASVARSVSRSTGVSVVAVLTFSKTSKTLAWTYFHFPWELEDLLYVPSGDFMAGITVQTSGSRRVVYFSLRENQTTGDTAFPSATQAIDWSAELPFLDCGTPGAMKQFFGMDVVANPGCTVQFRYDPNDPTRITLPQEITGPDTRPGGMIPVEVCAVAVAPVISGAQLAGDVRISGMQLYHESLGPV